MSENKYRIAIISINFAESTLGLAEALAEMGNHVDYYRVLPDFSNNDIPAYEIPKFKRRLFGLYKLSPEECKGASFAINNGYVNLYAYQSFPFGIHSKGIRKKIASIISEVAITYLCHLIKKKKYDFIDVIIQDKPGMLFIKHLKDETVINSLHEPFKDHLSNRTLVENIPYAISQSKRIRVFSDSAKSEITAVKPQLSSFIYTVPFGLFKSYEDFNCNDSEFHEKDYILFYGSIKPYKGLEYLYNAYIELLKARPETKLVIAGAGQDSCLEKFRKLPQCTIINKHLSNEELSSLISNCRFVVCPYKSASQSGIPQTVFVFDKPIIATNVGAFPDYIIPNISGQLVNYGDVKALKDAMIEMFEDRKQYELYVSNIHEFESLNPDAKWANIVERYKQMIDNLYGSIPKQHR